MLFQIVMWLEEDGTWLVFHRNGSFHQNEVSHLWYIYLHRWSVVDRRFLRGGGAKSLGGVGGYQHTILPNFPKNCIKLPQLDGIRSRKWRDRSRAKRNTVYTFRWWTVASDRCASFKQIDGQIKNWKRICLYFAMMIRCCIQMWVLQTNWWTSREPKQKLFLLCDDDLLLQTDVSPSNKLMDKSRTEAETLSTLRWWSVAANRCASFNEIDGQVQKRKFFYFAMMIFCCWWISVLQGHLLTGREPKETRFQDCGDQLLVLIVCVLWVNLAGASWRKQELFLSFLYTIYLLS